MANNTRITDAQGSTVGSSALEFDFRAASGTPGRPINSNPRVGPAQTESTRVFSASWSDTRFMSMAGGVVPVGLPIISMTFPHSEQVDVITKYQHGLSDAQLDIISRDPSMTVYASVSAARTIRSLEGRIEIMESKLRNSIPVPQIVYMVGTSASMTFCLSNYLIWRFSGVSLIDPISALLGTIASIGLFATAFRALFSWKEWLCGNKSSF